MLVLVTVFVTVSVSVSVSVSVEDLSSTPAGCDFIRGYDVRSDDHNQVGVWCSNGSASLCDLITDACTALSLPNDPPVTFLTFAPGTPDTIFIAAGDTNSEALYTSTDGSVTITWSADFRAHVIRVNPNDATQACALNKTQNLLSCTTDGGATWTDLTPPHLDPPYATYVRTFTWASDGAIWAVAHPGVIRHPSL